MTRFFLLAFACHFVRIQCSDYAILMQSDVVSGTSESAAVDSIKLGLQNLVFKQADRQLAVGALMRQVARVEKLSPEATTILNQVKALLAGISSDMGVDRDNEQAELDLVNGMIAACNVNLDAQDALLSATVAGAATDHSTCRTEEVAAFDHHATTCGSMTTMMTTLRAQTLVCVLPTASDFNSIGSWDDLFSHGVDYFTAATDDLTPLIAPCEAAQTALDDKNLACDQFQTTYESAVCQWRTNRIDQCSELDTCYATAETYYADTWARVSPLATTRKAEGLMIARIVCLIDNLMTNPQNFDRNACDNAMTDPELQTAYGVTPIDPLPAKDSCTMDDFAEFPGTLGWYAQAYGGLSSQAKAPAEADLLSC